MLVGKFKNASRSNQKIGRLAHPIYLPPISRVIKFMSLLIRSFIQRPFNYLLNDNDCQSEITVIIPICYDTELVVWFLAILAAGLSYLFDLIMLLWVSFLCLLLPFTFKIVGSW